MEGTRVFVRYWMKTEITTASETMTLFTVMECMQTQRIRRMPVLMEGKLTGIISLSDLYRFVRPGTEKKALLEKDTEDELKRYVVRDAMVTNVLTVTPETLLEDVGELFRKHRIGALPVIHGGRLVGILTESDYLRAVAKLSHIGEGRRVCFRAPLHGKAENFYDLVALCQKHGVELLTLTTQDIDANTHLVLLRVRGPRVDELIDALWKSKHDVLMSDPA